MSAAPEPGHPQEPAEARGEGRPDEEDRSPSRPQWRDRFARRRRDPVPTGRPLTAFVLAGGGSRGAVQVGMLTELVARGIRADRVYGASVGAVNAAAYCGDPTPRGIDHLQRVWMGITGDTIFPKGRVQGPWTYFQQRPAVHANSGLRRILEEGIRFERLEEAVVPLEVVATSLTDGRERWLTTGDPVEAVLASAAIPAVLPPVEIDGELLIDGGVVDNVPISRAVDAGATRIYVLLCGPLHFRPRPARRPAEAVLTAFFVAVHARFARELAMVPPDVEVIVFSGGGEPSADYRDFTGTAALVAAGRAEVARVLDERERAAHPRGGGRLTGGAVDDGLGGARGADVGGAKGAAVGGAKGAAVVDGRRRDDGPGARRHAASHPSAGMRRT